MNKKKDLSVNETKTQCEQDETQCEQQETQCEQEETQCEFSSMRRFSERGPRCF